MIAVKSGEKKDVAVKVDWTPGRGSGAIALTSPQRRILDSTKAVIPGFDWTAASWDATKQELYALFDSTAGGLTALGTYYVELKGTIGAEVYERAVTVQVVADVP